MGAGTKNRKISGGGAHKMAAWCHFPDFTAEAKGHLVIDGRNFAAFAQPFRGVERKVSSQLYQLHLFLKLAIFSST